MDWVLVASGIANDDTTGTLTLDTRGANLIIVIGNQHNGVGFIPEDNQSNSWGDPVVDFSAPSGRSRLQMYACYNPTTSDSHHFQKNTGNFFGCIAVLALSGAGASPFDVSVGAIVSGGTDEQPGPLTPTGNGRLIVNAVSLDDPALGDPPTWDGGFSRVLFLDNTPGHVYGLTIATAVQTSAAAVNPTMTRATAGTLFDVDVAAAFKPAITNYRLTAVRGSVTITGNAQTVKAARKVIAAHGSLALMGQMQMVKTARKIAAVQGALALTGKAVGLSAGRKIKAATGAYAQDGEAQGMSSGRKVAASSGAYIVTGIPHSVISKRILIALRGSYVATGQSVTLTRGGAGHFKLTALSGTYALAGWPQTLLQGSRQTGGSLWMRMRLERLLGRAVDAHWGEECRFLPMVRNEFGPADPDPSRGIVTVKGIFTLEPGDDTDLRGQRLRGEFSGTARVDLPKPRVTVTAEQATKIGYVPRQGDHIVLSDRFGQPKYEIADVETHDDGDLLIYLTQ